MQIPVLVLSAALVAASCTATPPEAPAPATEKRAVKIDHVMEGLSGDRVDLAGYRGKALLLVNVASECGYTPQYAGLQQLWEKYKDRGLVVVGIPSNDFGGQEPGTSEEIQGFCETKFGVTFPMLAKVHAKGPEMAPVYKTLTTDTPDGIRGEVRWNFTKFLVDPDGVPVARFEPKVEPMSAELVAAVEKVLPR